MHVLYICTVYISSGGRRFGANEQGEAFKRLDCTWLLVATEGPYNGPKNPGYVVGDSMA